MLGTFTFELVSPEKLSFSEPVTMVTAPGAAGEYGVLAGHAPMITEIKPGVIQIYTDNDITVASRLFVAGGFAEVTQTRFTVLADEAIPVSELKFAEIQAEVKDLTAKLANAGETEQDALQAQLDVATAKLQAAA